MKTRGCPETSVRNYHYSPCNNSEDRSSHLLRGGSLKPRNILDGFVCGVEILRCNDHQDKVQTRDGKSYSIHGCEIHRCPAASSPRTKYSYVTDLKNSSGYPVQG